MSRSHAVRPLSLKGYAGHRRALGLPGGSLRAVQEALGATRIPMRPDGRIDPVAADAAWEANTDASRRPHTNGHGPAAPSLSEQKRLESIQRTRQLTLENDWREGRTVLAAAAERFYVGMVVECRNALLAVPSHIKMRCPDATRAMLEVFDEEIRRCLESLAGRGAKTEEETDASETNGTTGPVYRQGAPDPEPLASAPAGPAG